MAGTLSKSMVRRWTERRLRDSNRAKELPASYVDERLSELDPPLQTHGPPLLHHQKVTLLLALKHRGYLPLLDMGTGKTRVMLDLYHYRSKQLGKPGAMLVLVPNVVNCWSWVKESETYTPGLRCRPLVGSRADKERELFDPTADILPVTYQGLMSLLSSGRSRGKMTLDPERVERLRGRYSTLVLDECTFVKNHRSLAYKTCKAVTRVVDFVYGLTGTPFGRDPHDLWSQFHIVDNGEALGETLGLFRSVFFKARKSYWSPYPEWDFDKSKTELLARMMRHSSVRYSEEECQDLPKRVYSVRPVEWSMETHRYYERLVRDLREAGGNLTLLDNIFTRMRQVASGYLVVKDAETGDRQTITFKDNPKLDAVVATLSEIPEGRKVVLFNEFVKSGELIANRLTELGVPFLRVYGKTPDKQAALAQFNEDPRIRVLVLNHQTGSKGLNLQVANHVLFFESPVSPIDRKQAEKRCHRFGQSRRVFVIDFPVIGSVEQKILRYLAEGRNLFRALVEGEVTPDSLV